MGNDESTPKGPVNSSYYGTTTRDITPENAAETIREMRLQKYEKNRQKRQEHPKFKILVSLTDFGMKDIEGVLILTFNLKSESSGKFVLTANGHNVTCNFMKSKEKTKIFIPLTEKADFDLEVKSFMKDYEGEIPYDSTIVCHQIYKFELINDNEYMHAKLLNQVLVLREKTIKIEKNVEFEAEREPLNSRCMFCLSENATKSVCNDELHKIICDDCYKSKKVQVDECPMCNVIKPPPMEEVDDLIY